MELAVINNLFNASTVQNISEICLLDICQPGDFLWFLHSKVVHSVNSFIIWTKRIDSY